ncbi:MAG: FAD:protein FMN transferase [Candidatus Saccharibacteria bacterium]|nr:FAD:protein FMN transferase [Moraxellaceae bacterium]
MIRNRPLLGTFVEIRVVGDDSATENAINAAFQAIETVQNLMSFHDKNSQLTTLNRQAHQHPITVHPWLYATLVRAARIHRQAECLFDCAIADVLVKQQQLPAPDIIVDQRATQADVQLLAQSQVAYRQPLWLDLGGIAKGFAVDMAIHTLRQHKVKQATVNAGGDLRVFGSSAIPISIRRPTDPQQLLDLGSLQNGACATSAIYHSIQDYNGQIVSALIDPTTRTSVMKAHSFSVFAPTATIADALTKVVAISGNPVHPCLPCFGAIAHIEYR